MSALYHTSKKCAVGSRLTYAPAAHVQIERWNRSTIELYSIKGSPMLLKRVMARLGDFIYFYVRDLRRGRYRISTDADMASWYQ